MTRPKSNKKGRTPSMSEFEDEVQWGLTTLEHGQLANECNRHADENLHAEDCNKMCQRVPLTEVEIELHNEIVEWNKKNWLIQGIPEALSGGPFPGIGVDILKEQFRLSSLMQTLIDKDIVTDEELNDNYKMIMIKKLKIIREKAEKAEASKKILRPEKGIILPGGNGEIKH